MVTRRIAKLFADRRATTAVEFAILLPAFLALTIGGVHASLALFSASSLKYAVQQAARCASVMPGTCGSAEGIRSYASSHYYALGQPNFAYTASACGNLVSGTVTYDIAAVVTDLPVALSASACFP